MNSGQEYFTPTIVARMSTVAATATPVVAPQSELSSRPLRLVFPTATVVLLWVAIAAIHFSDIEGFRRFLGRLAGVGIALLAILVWWMWQRSVPWRDRGIVLGAFLAAVAIVKLFVHPSLHGLELAVAVWAAPAMLTGWVGWLWLTRLSAPQLRRKGLLAVTALAWAWTLLVRNNGLTGQGETQLNWRWKPSGEEQFLAEHAAHRANGKADASDVATLVADDEDWPEFRGPARDGAVHGVTLRTDWAKTPPKQLWKRRVGPGWSSIIVVGNRLFTQEQRGDREAVVCCDVGTGDEVWSHEDEARFDEAMGGVGPRATPTFADGRIYALGATGLLNCLDAATGNPLWQADITKQGQGGAPYWGFCSSPLVVDGKVIVFAGSGGGDNPEAPAGDEQAEKEPPEAEAKEPDTKNTLQAYDAQSGDLLWSTPAGSHSYSSPQLATFDGQQQVLFISDEALDAVDPETGDAFWSLPTNGDESLPALQPHRVGESDLLATFNSKSGLLRVEVQRGVDGWRAKQEWVSRDAKLFFNDFVTVGETLYGFDKDLFCAVDLRTGQRAWKKGRYGSGQVLLVADQPALVVISEKGEAVLVAPDPEKHQELGRFQAIEGKTWNHPTIVRGRLYVRNADEMACYEL